MEPGQGDIKANLQDLKEDDRPQDVMPQQIWDLLHTPGYPMGLLVSSIRLLNEVPWTTLPAEQMHGSLAVFRRWHPEFGVESLLSRAFMLQLSRVLEPKG